MQGLTCVLGRVLGNRAKHFREGLLDLCPKPFLQAFDVLHRQPLLTALSDRAAAKLSTDQIRSATAQAHQALLSLLPVLYQAGF